MIITFFNKKGGVGKTSLAYNVARDLNFYLLSNDDSIIESSYENKAMIMEKIKLIKNQNVVYDLGGFVDMNIVDILKASDIIIVPTIADVNSLKRTINSVKELQAFNKNIIVVGNIIRGKQLDFITKYIDIKFSIRESKIFQTSLIERKSINEIVNESNLNAYRYRNIYKDYTNLLKHLKDLNNVI